MKDWKCFEEKYTRFRRLFLVLLSFKY